MKKINFKKVLSGRHVAILLLILASVFLFGHLAHADVFGEWAGNVVGGIVALFIRAIASILIVLVNVLMSVATYSDFINAPAVAKGWVVVRDLCNMFFVVILLIIAFATILGQEEYGAKKMLPKLIMAAVLINFSKLICGLMIDVSNVVMLTFVNAFSAIGAGNLLDLLGIADVTKIAVSSTSTAVTFGTIVSAYIFGLIYVIIATVVVAAMLGMLVVRLVMIWILVVLSPLAFFLQAVPGKGASYAGQWWNKWTSNLLVGPIIAFFLWLSFAALQGGNPIAVDNTNGDLAANNSDITDSSADGLGTKAGTPAAMAKFVIAIGMLLGGMKIAQEVGGEAGGAMGKIFSKGKGFATAAGIGALAMGGKAAGRGALNVVGKGVNLIPSKTTDANGNIVKRKGNMVGDFALGWHEDLTTSNKKSRKEAAAKYLKKVGIGEKGSEKGQVLIDSPGFQKTANVVKGAALGAITGGYGFAASTIGTAIAGGGIGGLAGYLGSAKRQKINEDVKKYENSNDNVDKAKLELANHDGHQNNVDEFNQKKQRASDLLFSKYKNGGTFSSKKDEDEYNEKDAFVKNSDNLKKYNDSLTYLSTSSRTDKENNLVNAENIASGDKDKYDSAKKWQERTGFLDRFKNTKAAMKDNTKKKAAAQGWVKIAAKDPDVLKNMNKPSEIYSSAGLSENWKKRFEELNGTDTNSVKAIDNMVSEINSTQNPLDDKKMEAFAKALAAFKKGDGKIEAATLGRIESALAGKGYSSAAYDGKVSTQYKQLGSSVEDVKDGSGNLQYDAFARNSAKAPTSRDNNKDIMGASFEKINDKAKSMGVDYSLDAAAGVNQKVDGAQLSNLSKVMSGLIDDEIKSLQSVGGQINNQKIAQLNTAKTRLTSGGLSGLSLKNTDVIYKGDTDSERRQNEYNTTQHENLHQYGAKNEEMVSASADALQQAKLIGRIPKSDSESGGKSYVEVLGKMIANMENSGASQEAMSRAVEAQVAKWQTPNAQRVVETENGTRDTVKDRVISTTEKSEMDTDKVVASIDKLTESLDKPLKVSGSGQGGKVGFDIPTINFFRNMLTGVKNAVVKGDASLSDKLKPLSAMAAREEVGSAGYEGM